MASTTVTQTMQVRRDALFAWFIPVDLPRILLGWGPLPAVVSTQGQTGPWDAPGSRRTVHLADGSQAEEMVTACTTPSHFAYRVTGFTNPLIRALAQSAEGEWTFVAPEPDSAATEVTWTYRFIPRSALAAWPLRFVVRFLWRGYMQVGLSAMKRLAEAEASGAPRA